MIALIKKKEYNHGASYVYSLDNKVSIKIEYLSDVNLYQLTFDVEDDIFPLTNISFYNNASGLKGIQNADVIIHGNLMNGNVNYTRDCLKEYAVACDMVEEINRFIKEYYEKYIKEDHNET